MAQIIASTYEILQEIGSGGGGIVYLARHLRLGKLVVMKADRRKLTTKPERLRCEVDSLKNLSHTYIPQVYDFIADEDKVYTVMDYIEGESLDKPLKRGERFSQPDIIKWASQLLEALCYLHSRPPHGILHSDIKPANVMLTPQGDICLIDFNIALALGEEGAVRVGFSRGYASPEHYGSQFATVGETKEASELGTDLTRSWIHTVVQSTSGLDYSSKEMVLLDVRSDIYSLGATLYHLLTGKRPAQDARDVEPISTEMVSPAVAAIIKKAMAPDPAQRYQTAEEMLYAFKHLHDNDSRARRMKVWNRAAAGLLSALFLLGGFTGFVGLQRIRNVQASHLLAEQSSNLLIEGKRDEAIATALKAIPEHSNLLTPKPTAQAQKALTDALGVYNLSDGLRVLHSVELPSEVLKLTLSPSGNYGAAASLGELSVFDVQSGSVIETLSLIGTALAEFQFIDDSRIVYASDKGIAMYDLTEKRNLWSGEIAARISVSADGNIIAASNAEGTCVTAYSVQGQKQRTIEFDKHSMNMSNGTRLLDPKGTLFALDKTGKFLAVSFSDGAVSLYDLISGKELVLLGESAYIYFDGGFSGKNLVFSAQESGSTAFVNIDTETLQEVHNFAVDGALGVQADETGIFLFNGTLVVQYDPITQEQRGRVAASSAIEDFLCTSDYTLMMTKEHGCEIFNKAAKREMLDMLENTENKYVAASKDVVLLGGLDSQTVYLLQFQTHEDKQIFAYDPAYAHSETRVNVDKTAAMLFNYRGFRLVDPAGTVISEVSLPRAEEIYDQQYYKDENGARLEVIYSDGEIIVYSGDTGEEIGRKEAEKAADETLAETFYTDQYRIERQLHGTPIVYDRETGREICRLQSDSYLIYVTQLDDYIIAQYMSGEGEFYSQLLDENCNVLAEIPDLVDVVGNMLVIDDGTGSVWETPIYELDELKILAEKELEDIK